VVGKIEKELEKKQGILYLCATPIGNLSDITFRVLDTLKSVDLIACEDTRNSIKLLNHFEIKVPMTSYHEYNKYDKANELIGIIRNGKSVALITDAGMPAISDPGEVLVRMCHEAGIMVTVLPGACACVTALALSGMSSRRFCFEGFLPPEKKERREILEELKNETRTMIIYEAPHHLLKTLNDLYENLGNRKVTFCKELTKRYEDSFYSDFENAINYYENNPPKGEFVLIIEGKNKEEIKKEIIDNWMQMSLEEHMEYYESKGVEHKEAMKYVARDRNMQKREVYNQLLKNN